MPATTFVAHIRSSRWLIAVFAVSAITMSRAQGLIDPGFEEYLVSTGGFIKPTSGVWSFANDAGVVEPPAPNSSTGPGNTWSATFSAIEGEQYASTYAGLDSIRQLVTFDAAGLYRVSAYAAAPSGSVTVPPQSTSTLTTGTFSFTMDATSIGAPHSLAPGTSWSLFSADFTITTPGKYEIGVRNTAAASYFINYDAFQIQPVPEPAVWQFALAVGVLFFGVRAFRDKARHRPAVYQIAS